MEIGLILALMTALTFAISNIFVRRGTYRAGESTTTVFISIFLGVIFFLVIILSNGDWKSLLGFPWQGFVQLGIAGIMHFVAGRFFSYNAFRLIGANKASAIIKIRIFYPVILGIIVLNESLTAPLIFGVLGVGAGAILVSMVKGDKVPGADDPAVRMKGLLAAVGGSVFWGISGVLIKPMVEQIGSPYAAAFIAYVAATLVMAGLLFGKGNREQLSRLKRDSIVPIVSGSLFTAISQMLRFSALKLSPVSVVEPLIGTNVLFIFILSFFLNRKIEVFGWKIFWGMVATVIGTFFFFL